MFSNKSQLVAAYTELCVALRILAGVRSKSTVMGAIDPVTRGELHDAFDKLYDWQDELEKAIKGLRAPINIPIDKD